MAPRCKETTRRNYSNYLKRFFEFCQLDPEEALKEAAIDRRLLHQKLKAFIEELQSIGFASKTRLGAYTAVRSFLNANDLPLGRTPRAFAGKAQYETNRILQPQELSLMIGMFTNTRDKAIISLLAQSGQRTGLLSALRLCHVRQELEKGVNPILVNVPAEILDFQGLNANKTGLLYQFAIGKECAMLLRMMMKERKDGGER